FDTLAAARAAAEVLDYAAPELVADPTRPTPAADQFALGAVGYFALTGRPPFPGPTLTDRLLAREAGPPAPVPVVNPDVPAALAVHPVAPPRSSLQDATERPPPIPAPGRPAEPVPPKPPSPAVVAPQPSPAQPEDPTMAKPRLLDAGGNPQPIPAPPPPRPT